MPLKPGPVIKRRCGRCYFNGHTVADCKAQAAKIRCPVCKQRGAAHRPEMCPERACKYCSRKGHTYLGCHLVDQYYPAICPAPGKCERTKCTGCRGTGHKDTECPYRSEWTCLNCSGTGHQYNECTAGERKVICALCAISGHLQTNCSNRYQWMCLCAKLSHKDAHSPETWAACNASEGDAKYDIGKFGEALVMFKRAVAILPDNPKGHWALGIAYAKSECYRDAMESFRSAAILDVGYPMDWDMLLDNVTQALDPLPDLDTDWRLLNFRALVLFLSGDIESARRRIHAAISHAPGDGFATVWTRRILSVERPVRDGHAFMKTAQWENAAERYSYAIEVLNEWPEASDRSRLRAKLLTWRSCALLSAGTPTYSACKRDLDEALRIAPSYGRALAAKAGLHYALYGPQQSFRSYVEASNAGWVPWEQDSDLDEPLYEEAT